MATDTLSGLQWLASVRPAADAAPALVADWYEAKAEILAAMGRAADAMAAHKHAVALLPVYDNLTEFFAALNEAAVR